MSQIHFRPYDILQNNPRPAGSLADAAAASKVNRRREKGTASRPLTVRAVKWRID